MPALPASVPPASYIPFTALAVPAAGEESTAVDRSAPLPVTTTFAAAGNAPLAGEASTSALVGPFAPELGRAIWLTLAGDWAGTVTVKRSVDGGATSHGLTAGGISWGVFSANACEQVAQETDARAQYYLDISIVAGTLAYEVAQ